MKSEKGVGPRTDPCGTPEVVVSSAKKMAQSGARTLGRSFMKSERGVGPRTEPCGTLEVVEPGDDVELDTRVT